MAEGWDLVQKAAAWEASAAGGSRLLPSQAEPQPAQSAPRHDSDRGCAAGLFGVAGIPGRKRTNRSLREESRPKRCRSELREAPEGKAGQSAPGWSGSARARRHHSDSSWGPHRTPSAAGWFSGRISQSQRRPPRWPPEPPSPGTPARTPLFHRLQWQHWRQRLEMKRSNNSTPGRTAVYGREILLPSKTLLRIITKLIKHPDSRN